MFRIVKPRRVWTREEDQILRDSVANHDGENINWHKVALSIPGWNNKDCRKRWVYALEPSKTKGPWAKEEDKLLRDGVEKHGLKWALVSRVVKSRQPDQCSRRWHECLNPKLKHDRWSLEEDQFLKEAVQLHGRRWTEIVERYFPDRRPISARNRYRERFEKCSGGGLAYNTYGEIQSTPDLCANTASIEGGSDVISHKGPYSLQHVRDHGQRQPGEPIVSAEEFDLAHGPSMNGSNFISCISGSDTLEGSNRASMSSVSISPINKRNGTFNPASATPQFTYTAAFNGGPLVDTSAVPTVLRDVRFLNPWELSSTASLSHSGTSPMTNSPFRHNSQKYQDL